jgi:transposase InsO family protein
MEARVPYHDWRHLYNHYRPHSALRYQPPAVFAAAFTKPGLS